MIRYKKGSGNRNTHQASTLTLRDRVLRGIAVMIGLLAMFISLMFVLGNSSIRSYYSVSDDTVAYEYDVADQPEPVNIQVTEYEDTDVYEETETVHDIWLTELDHIKKGDVSVEENGKDTTNTGEEMYHYMYSRSPYSEIVYNLNGDYDELSATWAVCKASKNTTKNSAFDIYADNELIYSSPVITGGSLPVQLNLDITGCQILTIMFKEGDGEANLGDIRLHADCDKTDTVQLPVPDVLPTWLTELDYLTDRGMDTMEGHDNTTNTGEIYAHYMYGECGDEVVYYLDKKYSSISGIWAICSQNKNTNTTNSFAIYADDELVYASPVITAESLPEAFNVDIKHCSKLRIQITDGNGAGEIGNIRLMP